MVIEFENCPGCPYSIKNIYKPKHYCNHPKAIAHHPYRGGRTVPNDSIWLECPLNVDEEPEEVLS